jgi:hypothetical protein
MGYFFDYLHGRLKQFLDTHNVNGQEHGTGLKGKNNSLTLCPVPYALRLLLFHNKYPGL